jgi:hypothetical protein
MPKNATQSEAVKYYIKCNRHSREKHFKRKRMNNISASASRGETFELIKE